MKKLRTRDEFREGVFKRDNHKCVFCDLPAKDAHHILERRLFEDGGYYLDNGASVCEFHHLACEATDIDTDDVRKAAGITNIILPDHLYSDQRYDKWGNPILPNETRLRGELFHDESVQKILKPWLHIFTDRVKYPRTYHLPWSENMNKDDRMHKTTTQWNNMEVVITEKIDGENTTWYRDYTHARSIDSKNHPSRNRAKAIWSEISGEIPEGWRVVVENMFAVHSIKYDNLESYVYGLSIWNEKNICLSWDETTEWFQLLGIPQPKILYRGTFQESLIKTLYKQEDWDTCEGYVLRPTNEFSYAEFKKLVAKYVRKGHIQTTKHWMAGQAIEKNGLK